MDLLRFIPAKLTLLLAAGIMLGKYLGPPISLCLLFCLISLAFLGSRFLGKHREFCPAFILATAGCTLCLGMLAYCLSLPENFPSHYSHLDLSKKSLLQLKVVETLKPSAYSHRYIVQIEALDSVGTMGKLLLSIPQADIVQPLLIDRRIVAYASVEPIKPPLNPHDFNFRDFMAGQGVYHQLRLKRGSFCLTEPGQRSLRGWAESLRIKMLAPLQASGFGAEELAVVKALLLGDRSDIPASTYQAYKDAGAVHILALSGMHIGIILFLIDTLMRPLLWLPRGRQFKLGISLLLLWGYAFLTGMAASTLRAVCMFSFVAYALFLNRPSSSSNILALSMFFILLAYDARLLFQVGFQLSYAAVFAILLLYPEVRKLVPLEYWLPTKAWQLLSVSIAAQLGVLPISLYYFHQFPGLFFLSNLLLVPVLGLILVLGFLSLALAGWEFSVIITQGYALLIGLVNEVVDKIASYDSFVWREIPFDLLMVFLAYIVLAAVYGLLKKVNFRSIAFLLSAVLLVQLWQLRLAIQTGKEESLWVMHQGRNTLIVHRKGRQMSYASFPLPPNKSLLSSFRTAGRIKTSRKDSLAQAYILGKSGILLPDNSGGLPATLAEKSILLMHNSPEFNLDRLLDSIPISRVIADGSNYFSLIERWERSCQDKNIPFWYTGEDGAFKLE